MKTLFIGENVQLNDFVHITAMESVIIGNDVLMASHIYISDCSHGSYNGDLQVSTHCMALAFSLVFFYLRFEFKNRMFMNKSEFYSEFLFRYQTEGVSEKISINTFCIREGVDYGSFIRWYRENKKRMRESEMEEIRLSPIHVLDSAASVPLFSTTPLATSDVMNVVCFHLKLDNGIEINKEHANLRSITTLLQILSKLC